MAITDPRDIPGLVAWYSAKAETGYTTGGVLTQWTDQSGKGNHALPPTSGGTAPTWSATAGPNGEPAIVFDALTHLVLPNLLTGATSGEIVATVYSPSDTGPQSLWAFGTSLNASHYPFSSVIYDDFGNTVRRTVGNPTPTMIAWRTLNLWSASNDWAFRYDGVTQHSQTTNTVGWRTAPTIGTDTRAGSQNRFKGGAVGLVLLYNRKLTTAERADLDTWVASNRSGGVPVAAPVSVRRLESKNGNAGSFTLATAPAGAIAVLLMTDTPNSNGSLHPITFSASGGATWARVHQSTGAGNFGISQELWIGTNLTGALTTITGTAFDGSTRTPGYGVRVFSGASTDAITAQTTLQDGTGLVTSPADTPAIGSWVWNWASFISISAITYPVFITPTDTDVASITSVTSTGNETGTEGIAKLIDGSTGSKWLTSIIPSSATFTMPAATDAGSYTITSANDVDQRDPKDWTLSGSNDNSTWTVIDTRTEEPVWATRGLARTYTISTPGSYLYYRWTISASRSTLIQVAEFSFAKGTGWNTVPNLGINGWIDARTKDRSVTTSAVHQVSGQGDANYQHKMTQIVVGSTPTSVSLSINRALEIDAARPITVVQAAVVVTVSLGRAIEVDSAYPVTVVTPVSIAIGRAVETNIARSISAITPGSQVIGRAVETDIARPIGVSSFIGVNVGKAYEIDIAQPLSVIVFTAEPPPYNDFANALSVDYDYGGEYLTLVNSTIEPGEVVPSGHTSSVWATWSAEENATMSFVVSASPVDTPYTVTVYHTNWTTQVVQYSVVGDLSFDVDILTGLTYWIRISSATDDLGVELSWLLDGAIEPPADPVEYLRCEVYEPDGTTLITEVASRFGASGQEPLNITGAGQLGIKLDDNLLDIYPGLLVFGNIVKYFLANTCIHGFRIKGRSTNYVSTDEWKGWVRTVSGPSVHHLLDDFMVQHNLPLQDRRLATRAFTWAAPAGAWYKSSDWVSTYNTNTQADPPGQENSLPQNRPKWKNPPKFPDAGAEWMWVSPEPSRNERGFAPPPMLGQRYFRKTFILKKRTTVKMFASADEKYKVYLDGEEVLTGDGEEMGFTETQTRKLTLTEGLHTIAIRGSQFSQEKILEERELEKEKGEFKDPDDAAVDGDGDGIINEGTPEEGPAPVAPPEDTQEPDTTTVRVDDGMDAILFTMMRLDDDGKPSTVVVRSNGSWLTTYVRPVPAWKRATILRRVVNEAKHRGNTSANLLTFGFDNVRDSRNRRWLDRWNHPVDIGTSALELQGMLSEGNNFDVWIDPEDLKIHAWRRRGRDRSKNIALEAGRNLLDWNIEETEEVKNDYLVQYDGGWFRWKTKNSIRRFGEREAFITMGRSKSDRDARRTLERAARGIAAAAKRAGTGDFKRWHEGAPSGSIIAVPGARPFLDYGVGDVIMAPNENSVMKRHRVLSLTFTEDDNRLVTYDAELEEL